MEQNEMLFELLKRDPKLLKMYSTFSNMCNDFENLSGLLSEETVQFFNAFGQSLTHDATERINRYLKNQHTAKMN